MDMENIQKLIKSICVIGTSICLCGCSEKNIINNQNSIDTLSNIDTQIQSYQTINYSYQKHPWVLLYDDKEYAFLSYTTIEIYDEPNNNFTLLKQRVEEFNEQQKQELIDTDDKNIINNLGYKKEYISDLDPYTFKHTYDLIPCRADSEVFSYVLYEQWYTGGATTSVFWRPYNFDSSCGRDIDFSDVIKNTDIIPDIIVERITKINEQLPDQPEPIKQSQDSCITNMYIMNQNRDFIADEHIKKIPVEDSFYEYLREWNTPDGKYMIWLLDYDGVWFFFGGSENRAYGIKILYEEYPDIFFDGYFHSNPNGDITSQVTEIQEAEKQIRYLH